VLILALRSHKVVRCLNNFFFFFFFNYETGVIGWSSEDPDRIKYAKLAAAQGERDGFFGLSSVCRTSGKMAAELGDVWGMLNFANQFLDESDPEQFVWYSEAARKGDMLVCFLLLCLF
jgi:hypothetical protein